MRKRQPPAPRRLQHVVTRAAVRRLNRQVAYRNALDVVVVAPPPNEDRRPVRPRHPRNIRQDHGPAALDRQVVHQLPLLGDAIYLSFSQHQRLLRRHRRFRRCGQRVVIVRHAVARRAVLLRRDGVRPRHALCRRFGPFRALGRLRRQLPQLRQGLLHGRRLRRVQRLVRPRQRRYHQREGHGMPHHSVRALHLCVGRQRPRPLHDVPPHRVRIALLRQQPRHVPRALRRSHVKVYVSPQVFRRMKAQGLRKMVGHEANAHQLRERVTAFEVNVKHESFSFCSCFQRMSEGLILSQPFRLTAPFAKGAFGTAPPSPNLARGGGPPQRW